jgi:hypothetical protein
MNHKSISKYTAILISIATVLGLSTANRSYAAQSSITKTGPGSNNIISGNTNNTCYSDNSNDLDLHTNTAQNASTGNIDLDNVTSVASGWDSWNPSVWKKNGYTYQQWHSAFMSYLSGMQSRYNNDESFGNDVGGISTGDATNTNSAAFGIVLKNGGTACHGQSPANSGKIDTTGPGSTNTIQDNKTTVVESAQANKLRLSASTAQDANSGGINGTELTKLGNSNSGGSNNNNRLGANIAASNDPTTTQVAPIPALPPTGQNTDASIKLTGPGSTNTITSTNTNSINSSNSNSAVIHPKVTQYADSGAVDVGNITHIGTADSSNSDNQNIMNANLVLTNK